jgi:hypothetical protein
MIEADKHVAFGRVYVKTNLTGTRFGRWIVIRRAGRRHTAGGNVVYECFCRCDCGIERNVAESSLISGRSTSCGCFHKEVTANLFTTHGGSRSPEYSSWQNMLSRCLYSCTPKYYLYGGRGIKVCERWSKFENFLEDMGKKPRGHTLDRIDSNKNYDPENCRWATPTTQARNTSRNHFITINGDSKCVHEWAEIYGIQAGMIFGRLKRGWEPTRAVTEPRSLSSPLATSK